MFQLEKPKLAPMPLDLQRQSFEQLTIPSKPITHTVEEMLFRLILAKAFEAERDLCNEFIILPITNQNRRFTVSIEICSHPHCT